MPSPGYIILCELIWDDAWHGFTTALIRKVCPNDLDLADSCWFRPQQQKKCTGFQSVLHSERKNERISKLKQPNILSCSDSEIVSGMGPSWISSWISNFTKGCRISYNMHDIPCTEKYEILPLICMRLPFPSNMRCGNRQKSRFQGLGRINLNKAKS